MHYAAGRYGTQLCFFDSAIPSALVDRNGIFIEANAAFSGFFGYLPNEIIGQSFERYTHPEDIDADNAAIERLLARKDGATHYEMDKRYISKRGKAVWFRLVVNAIWQTDDLGGDDYFSHFFVLAFPYSDELKISRGKSDDEIRISKKGNVIQWVKANRWFVAFCFLLVCLSHPDIGAAVLAILLELVK